MCGIVGYIGSQDSLALILSGLEKLEYRGYDSAGVAIYEDGKVNVTRAMGKLGELKKLFDLKSRTTVSRLGIGHTRWATHGKPSENNAHPHTAGRVSLIHNGIIENYIQIRERLREKGSSFKSETDTEIVAHLLNMHLVEGAKPFDALVSVCREIKGSYAFVAIDAQNPNRLLVAKNSTPIIIGIGEGEMFVASDIPAFLPYTRKIMVLEDGDIAEVKHDQVYIENGGKAVQRPVQTVTWDPVAAQKGGFKHFMLKEIHEQGQVAHDTFRGRIELENPRIFLPEINLSDEEIKAIQRITLVACGTAWHACLVAKYYLEDLTGIPCEVDYASEFRYRNPVLSKNDLLIVVSQSGETLDTLGAVEYVMGKDGKAGSKCHTLAICNCLGSSLARRVTNTLFTHAGPEISVASTKAFSTQLVALYSLAVYIAQKREKLRPGQVLGLITDLIHLPAALDRCMKLEKSIEKIARKFQRAKDFLFLGRGTCFPIALEGALKLKEISYIHASGYPAGEMKHGPIALIDENVPVVMLLQQSSVLFEKTLSNLREVEARGGKIIAITDVVGNKELERLAHTVIEVPYVSEHMTPIIMTVPLQFLAYYVAVLNGTDVDLPRNLAKSVTVE